MNFTDTQTTSGGSRSTDFQPPTQNPQGNVGGGLQPVTTNNNSNVFNQPGVNAQAFPKTNSLRVQTNKTGEPASVTQTSPSAGSSLLLPLLLGIAAIVVLIVLALSSKPADKLEKKLPETPQAKAEAPKNKTKKKKKTKRKK